MLVAVCDQLLGTSTFSCLKIVTPFSLPIRAVRFSHSTLSNGETFPSVKNRSNTNPADVAVFDTSTAFPFNACFTVAILFPPRHRFPKSGGEPYSLLPWKPGGRGFARNPQPDPGIGRFFPPKSRKKTNALSDAGAVHTAEQRNPALHNGLARSSYFALVFCGDTGVERGSITDQGRPQLDPSGASTSPESGFAGSVHAFSVSSKNRKIW